MTIIHKRATSTISTDTLIFTGPCWYYGFTGKPGGADRTVAIYDNTAASGTKVEDFIIDGSKTTDGHSHAIPVYCANGLYVTLTGGAVNIFYKAAKMP